MDCFGTYFTHAQSCDNVRVPSASGHMLNLRVFAFSCFRAFCVFAFSAFSCFIRFRAFAFACFRIFADFKMLYGMDCFGTYFTHAQSCDNVRVQSATEWTASVHTLDMLIML